jgi:hypothetical protein
MSKIKELKSNTNNILNIVDVLELFIPDKKSKYTDMMIRIMNRTENIDEYVNEVIDVLTNKYDFLDKEDLKRFGNIQLILLYKFVESYFNDEDLTIFRKFCEYNERSLISQNDLSKYNNFNEITDQVNLADIKVVSKELEREIVKVYESDEWLLIRPLTYLSSRKYGSNTKWCTTSSDSSDYFKKYSERGVLIYCINKITGYKVASFYSLNPSDPEFSFWDQKDTRVDSLDTELTDELRLVIRETSKSPSAVSNHKLLPKEKREKEYDMKRHKTHIGTGEVTLTTTGTHTTMTLNGTTTNTVLTNGTATVNGTTAYTTLLSDRINNAINRENEVVAHTNTMSESINAIRELLDITYDIPNELEYQDGEELEDDQA